MMFAIDDGLTSGNLNFADILFLIAAVLFALAAIIPFTRRAEGSKFDLLTVAVPAGLALTAFGLFLL